VSPDHRVQSLRRKLAETYRLTEYLYTAPDGRMFTVTGVDDVDALLEELIISEPDSVEVRDERLPYWASLWPSAMALADEILTGGWLRPESRVLELGCGLGLCAAAASLKGSQVTATDYQPDALVFTQLNCLQIAGQHPKTEILDWRSPPVRRHYDTLIGSDLAYEARFFPPLLNCFDHLLAPGGHILFSEANRDIAYPFFQQLKQANWQCRRLSNIPATSVYLIMRPNE